MLSASQFLENPNGFLEELRRVAFSNPLYAFSLTGKTPARLLGTPPELLPGNAAAGQTLLAGAILHNGRRFAFAGFDKGLSGLSEDQTDYLHGFSWLSGLRRVGTLAARQEARRHISAWIDLYSRWHDAAWRPDLLGARLTAWLTHFGFYAGGDDPEFTQKVLTAIARQSRHLSRTGLKKLTDAKHLSAIQGLIHAGICLPDSDGYLGAGLEYLENELNRQILPDGGHLSRNPSQQFRVMWDLVTIRETLRAAHIDAPGWLDDKIAVMAPMLRALRHNDGGLALFNGGDGGESEDIDALLSLAGVRGKALSAAPHSGFHRVAAGRTTVLMDAGAPPPAGSNSFGHAGALSFEMSCGKERLIVNCGSGEKLNDDWRTALRGTSAHSTLAVDDLNSAEINPAGGYFQVPGPVSSSRREHEGRKIIEGMVEVATKSLAMKHRRILTIEEDGTRIAGEDRVSVASGRTFACRFHLHPNVQATLIQKGTAVLLKPRRGPGWKFSTVAAELKLEDSIYVDGARRPRRTQQIVLEGVLAGGAAEAGWELTQI